MSRVFLSAEPKSWEGRYLLQRTALELFFHHAAPALFDFFTPEDRNKVYKHLKNVRSFTLADNVIRHPLFAL